MSSPNTSLQQEVAATLQTNASLQEGLDSVTLTVQAVNDVGTRLDERGLEHVGQQGEDRVEGSKLCLALLAVLDTSQELGENTEIKNQRSSKQRVLLKE